MDRRTFALSGSAALALVGNRALAQRGATSSDVLISELTGGEADISGTELTVSNQHIDEADGSEHIHFVTDDDGQFDIYFWPQSSGDSGDMTESLVEMYTAVMPDTEILGTDEYEDGGWVAFDAGRISYYEYQRDAYPGHDLILLMTTLAVNFERDFDQAQAVMIDGMPPFLFDEDAGIVALVAERATSSTSTSSRSSRSSRTSTTEKTDEPDGRSGTEDAPEDPVKFVRAHREAFLDSYDDFLANLDVAGGDNATPQEIEDSFTIMLNHAADWQKYPDTAATVSFPANLADLKTVYLHWADAVANLGVAFDNFVTGTITVDDFLDVHIAWEEIDADLLSILGSLGPHGTRRAMHKQALSRPMKALSGVT